MNLKNLAGKLVFAAMVGLSSLSHAAPILTDIVFVVDESGSMDTVQANLRNNIGLFASILTGTGQVDARYALVGYGNSSVVPRILTDFTSAAAFATAAAGLQISGSTEPGYVASAFALNGLDGQANTLSYRSNAVKNVILLTDEASNGDSGRGSIDGTNVTSNAAGMALVDGVIKENNALFNAILEFDGVTPNSYSALATGNHGQVFNLTTFNTTNQAVIEQFVTDFAQAKLQETLDFCELNPQLPECQPTSVPEPGMLSLLGLGLLQLGIFRRRSKAA